MRIFCVMILPFCLMFLNFFLVGKGKEYTAKEDTGSQENKNWIRNRKVLLYIVMSSILLLLLSGRLIWYCPEQNMLFQCKRVILVSILFTAAMVDWKYQIIPNRLLAAGIVYRVILLIAEVIFSREKLSVTLISELAGAMGIFLICMFFLLLMKNSIGMGDIKLFMVMGLYLGIYSMMNAIMSSLILIFFYAVYLLITKKKGKKDVLPFAPAVLAGTYLSVFLTGI